MSPSSVAVGSPTVSARKNAKENAKKNAKKRPLAQASAA
jgi:hypothetical protein